MAKFITLTNANKDGPRPYGAAVRVKADDISDYAEAILSNIKQNEVATLIRVGGFVSYVRETPEQIDALLGVTESNISMDGLRTMEALRNLIYAAQGGNADRDNSYMLRWLADRLVEKYGESPDSDFIRACRERAAMLDQWLPVARSALRAARGE